MGIASLSSKSGHDAPCRARNRDAQEPVEYFYQFVKNDRELADYVL